MKLFLLPPFDDDWFARDPFAAVEALDGEVYRALEGRCTLRTEVAGQPVFAKIHRGVGWSEILKNLIRLRWPVTSALNEWRAISRLEELGVATMRALAAGERGGNPARRHSFLVTAELAPTISLEDLTRHWREEPPTLALKRAVLRRVASMVRRMHEGGMNHRDCYLCHFLVHEPIPEDPRQMKISLIDLHRAQIRRRVPRRWRDKDLAALYFSALPMGLSRLEKLRFLRLYFGRPLRDVLRDEARSLRWLEREVVRLEDRYYRRFAPGVES